MSNKVFISCAITGSGDTASKHPDLPKTPEQIATASIEAAKAGAAIAHIHVREEDGTPSRRLELYKEVVDRVRSSDTDVILNLTTGMGGDLDIGQGDNPLDFGPMTDMANVMERIANAEQFLPEICTLDAGTLNFGDSSVITVNTPNDLRKAAKKLKDIKNKKAVHSSLGAAAFTEAYKAMKGNGNLDEYSNAHPIVRTHPETGKKILYVNSMYTKKILETDEQESDEILNEIFMHQERLDFTCRFKWSENAVAIWDNRSTLHQGLTDFFPGRGLGHKRVMERNAVEGDLPL